jgi:hypothetical protein
MLPGMQLHRGGSGAVAHRITGAVAGSGQTHRHSLELSLTEAVVQGRGLGGRSDADLGGQTVG